MTAVGVASPNVHGQATTIVAIAKCSAMSYAVRRCGMCENAAIGTICDKSCKEDGVTRRQKQLAQSAPTRFSHTTYVAIAETITNGANRWLMASAYS